MGIEDRDYYLEHVKRLQGQTYNPREFRGRRSAAPVSGGWVSVMWRVLLICLAVYGGMSLIQDYKLGIRPWTAIDPVKFKRLLPYVKK